MPSNRKRKSGDPNVGSNAWGQRAGNSNPPSPSQHSRPRKKGRLSRQSEARTIDVSEDDGDQIGGEEDDRRKRWTDAELKQFAHAVMGPDGCWEKFLKNPTRVFKKVSAAAGKVALTLSNLTLRLLSSTFRIVLTPRH